MDEIDRSLPGCTAGCGFYIVVFLCYSSFLPFYSLHILFPSGLSWMSSSFGGGVIWLFSLSYSGFLLSLLFPC